jgi:hypothetical protein
MLIEKVPVSPFGGASTQAGSHRLGKPDCRGAELATQLPAGRPRNEGFQIALVHCVLADSQRAFGLLEYGYPRARKWRGLAAFLMRRSLVCGDRIGPGLGQPPPLWSRGADFELVVGRTANPVDGFGSLDGEHAHGIPGGKMEARRPDWQDWSQFGCSSRDHSPDREGVAKTFGASAVHLARFWSSPGSSRFPSRLNLWPVFYPALRITRTRGPASNPTAQDWALAVFRPGV